MIERQEEIYKEILIELRKQTKLLNEIFESMPCLRLDKDDCLVVTQKDWE